MERSVLYIDSDPHARERFCNLFRMRLDVDIAESPAEALKILDPDRPHAVVVAPVSRRGFDGLSALLAATERSPSTVPICIPKLRSLPQAINALERGQVFRIVRASAKREVLVGALDAGIQQHQLLTSRRTILTNSLESTISMLADKAASVDETGEPSVDDLTSGAVELAREIGLEDLWDLRLACMVCRIGVLALPPGLRTRLSNPLLLTRADHEALSRVPDNGARLLYPIVGLEAVATIVRYQSHPFASAESDTEGLKASVPPEARVIRVVRDFLLLRAQGQSQREALYTLRSHRGLYDPELLDTWECLRFGFRSPELLDLEANKEQMEVAKLYSGLTLAMDVHTDDKRLLLAKGTVLTSEIIDRLQRFVRSKHLHPYLVVYAADCDEEEFDASLSEVA